MANPFCIPFMFGVAGQILTGMSERETERARVPAIRTGGLTDKITCPGVDVDKYRAECRAHVFRDAWNHWKLLRSTADGLTIDKLSDAAKAFMGMVSKDLDGKIRQVEVVVGKQANPWNTPVLENRNGVCMTPMTLRASDFAPAYYEVFVRFVYRGLENDIVWPARKVGASGAASTILDSHCPVGADWLLDAVYTPSQEGVPSPEKDKVLPDWTDPYVPDAPADWSLESKLLVGGGIALGVAVLAGYAVRSFK